MIRTLSILLVVLATSLPLYAQAAPQATPSVPKEAQTSLGLYVTPAEAYAKWKAAPDSIRLIDVRTPEEYVFVGHPPMAWNVPLALQTLQWDPKGKFLLMKPNPEFLARASEVAGKDDTILVICRSGSRSARAANALAAAGYTKVYNGLEGVEGDLVNDPSSPLHGQREKNGWKNAGLPITYELDPAKMKLPESR